MNGGEPVAVRVFKGNTNDHKTVQEQIIYSQHIKGF